MSGPSTLITGSPTLPLESAALRVTAKGGIARVVLEQRFANHHTEPLAITYVLPLPADAAVSGYAFCIGDRRIEGDIDRRKAARERYDDAIARGAHGGAARAGAVGAPIGYHRHVLCPACNGRVDLQATVCSSCSFDIAARDPAQMVVRARRDLKVAIGLLLIGFAGAALCVLLYGFAGGPPPGAPLAIGALPPGATIVGLGLGSRTFRSARRRLAVARTIERVPSARVVTGKRP